MSKVHNLMKALKVKALADKIPGWVWVGGVTLGTAAWGALQSSLSDLLKDVTSEQFTLVWPILWHALAAGLIAEVGYLKTDPWAASEAASRAARTNPPSSGSKLPPLGTSLFSLFFLGVLLSLTSGCLSSAPIVSVTPQNTTQISSCESSATVHNVAALTGIGLGVIGTGLGSVAAVETDSNVKTGLAAGGAVSAALAGGAAAVTALAAENFANSQCSSVVGPLPTKPGKAASGWPAEWPKPKLQGGGVI
jgi:hypothetical protein